MIPVLSREQMRAFDRHAMLECRVPSVVLMENAGRGAADLIARETPPGPIVVMCGAGNNGGDGFVVARRLRTLGRDARVLLAVDSARLTGDALVNFHAWRGIGGETLELRAGEEARLEDCLAGAAGVADGLLGTGLDRDVTGWFRELILRINAASAFRAALDLPSGLHADTGAVLGAAVRAHLTVTFAHPKLGLYTTSGAEHAGRVEVVDIGVPGTRMEACAAYLSERADVAHAVVARPVSAHKSSAGRVLAIAGSAGKTGAALLVARGALRAGAGLVTIATFPEVQGAVEARALEEMTARIDPVSVEASLDALLEGTHSVAIGPGLGLDERARRVTEHVVLRWDGVKVVDADALTHFAGRAGELAGAAGRLILTPHSAELGRLLDRSAAEVEADRFGALARAVELTRAVVLLKGPRTLVGAPGRLPVVNATGVPALATGGAGDVLSGMIAALAVHAEPFAAAWSGAYLHGRAGERWGSVTRADRGLVAHELADALPACLGELRA
ncbi:MAG: NAD(P)H-hydrate dehydratase [Sorangiineae bacterium]|nr:NAD(P)H-hydrate dehydratase [Polyangiaceae bacterium]MEB2321149.1 NAD(P)H-hydrate dehydratase [Sorangiineae bacterium]